MHNWHRRLLDELTSSWMRGHTELLRRWIAEEHGVHWRILLLHTESSRAHWHLGHLLRNLELWHTHELWWHLHHLLLEWVSRLLLHSHHLLHLLTRHHLLLRSLHLLLLLWLLLHLLCLWFWRSLHLDIRIDILNILSNLSWFLLFNLLFSFEHLWWCLSFFNLLNYLGLFLFLQLFVRLDNFLFGLNLIGFGSLGNILGLLL